jgi:hypothetical protein
MNKILKTKLQIIQKLFNFKIKYIDTNELVDYQITRNNMTRAFEIASSLYGQSPSKDDLKYINKIINSLIQKVGFNVTKDEFSQKIQTFSEDTYSLYCELIDFLKNNANELRKKD